MVKKPSRLQRLVTSDLPEPRKVVGAGEAIDHDLNVPRTAPSAKSEVPQSTHRRPESRPRSITPALTKRTFRLSRSVDAQLKKFVRRYNARIEETDPELTLEEVGAIMIEHFLSSEPTEVTDRARGKR